MRNIKNKRYTLTCGGCSVHQKYKARLECARGSHFWRRFNLFNGPPQDRRVKTIPVLRPSVSLAVRSRSLELALSQTQRKTYRR